MVVQQTGLVEQIGDDGLVDIASDGVLQDATEGNTKAGMQSAMSYDGAPDDDLAAGVALAVTGFPARIEIGQPGFELALADEQLVTPGRERFLDAPHCFPKAVNESGGF
jgi:hypothetical protein